MRVYYIAVSALVITGIFSCNKDVIEGEGDVQTAVRSTAAFDKVLTEGSTKVYITRGNELEVKIKGFANLLPYLETVVDNGQLYIRYKHSANIKKDNSEVFITMPALVAVQSYGSGDVRTVGAFSADQLTTVIKGAANIMIDSASVKEISIDISGSGNLAGFGVVAQQARIAINGSGDTEITVLKKMITTIHGSGNVYYKGNPTIIENDIRGSGKVIKQ